MGYQVKRLRRAYYKCSNCDKQYSPHLSDKCPRCKSIYLNEFHEIGVRVDVPIASISIALSVLSGETNIDSLASEDLHDDDHSFGSGLHTD